MKKILSIALALMLVVSMFAFAGAEETAKYKIGILAPAVTHGWVAAVAYEAEQRCIALSDEVEYKLCTSNNADEMTAQLSQSKPNLALV